MLPPLVASTVLTAIVGAGGLLGWALWLLFAVVAWVVWLPIVRWLAPWRRRS
jgi:hypothetical protein